MSFQKSNKLTYLVCSARPHLSKPTDTLISITQFFLKKKKEKTNIKIKRNLYHDVGTIAFLDIG